MEYVGFSKSMAERECNIQEQSRQSWCVKAGCCRIKNTWRRIDSDRNAGHGVVKNEGTCIHCLRYRDYLHTRLRESAFSIFWEAPSNLLGSDSDNTASRTGTRIAWRQH